MNFWLLHFLRRSFISFEQNNFEAALIDLNAACPYARFARSPLKGLVFQVAGHVQAHRSLSGSEQKQALSLLDAAACLAYAGPYEDDENFVKFSSEWHHVERAEAYLALRKPMMPCTNWIRLGGLYEVRQSSIGLRKAR